MAHDVSYRNSDQKGRGDSLQHDKARASESVVEADETEQEGYQVNCEYINSNIENIKPLFREMKKQHKYGSFVLLLAPYSNKGVSNLLSLVNEKND